MFLRLTAFCSQAHFNYSFFYLNSCGCRSPPPFRSVKNHRNRTKGAQHEPQKNIFEKFPKKWPKGAFGKPVRGERGNHDLPSGAKGGENMDLEHHYRHKQHTFDAFCKRTIRNESANAFRQVRVQRDRFVPLSDLSDEGSEALATYDLYPQ